MPVNQGFFEIINHFNIKVVQIEDSISHSQSHSVPSCLPTYAQVKEAEKKRQERLKKEENLSFTTRSIPPEKIPLEASCENCMLMRRGDCFGGTGMVCEFYRFAPTIPQAERDSWPKYGDATYFRMLYGKH